MRAVVEKPQCASAACSIVDDLSHHGAAFVEEELVADAYLACRLNEHVPQAHLLVEFAKQEYFYFRVGLLLRSVEACRENLGVVEDESVAFVEVVEHIAEVEEVALYGVSVGILVVHVYGLRLAVQHHEPTFVATGDTEGVLLAGAVYEFVLHTVRIECYLLLRQLKLEL